MNVIKRDIIVLLSYFTKANTIDSCAKHFQEKISTNKTFVDFLMMLQEREYIKKTESGNTFLITEKGRKILNRLSRENVIKLQR